MLGGKQYRKTMDEGLDNTCPDSSGIFIFNSSENRGLSLRTLRLVDASESSIMPFCCYFVLFIKTPVMIVCFCLALQESKRCLRFENY